LDYLKSVIPQTLLSGFLDYFPAYLYCINMPPIKQLIIYLIIITVLSLTAFNIHLISSPNKVLGIETETRDRDREFWDNFLKQHPNYIPGLIETKKLEKVKQIDPNYQIGQ